MSTNSAVKALLCVVIGAVTYFALITHPAPGWASNIDWGDVATWCSSFATLVAVIVALQISRSDSRRREREKLADQQLADYRIANLLRPTFATAVAVSEAVVEKIGKFERGATGTMDDLREDFQISSLELIVSFAEFGRAASKEFSLDVLATIAWAHQTIRAIEMCFLVDEGRSGGIDDSSPKRYTLHNIKQTVPQLIRVYTLVGYYAERSAAKMDAILGEDIGVPHNVMNPPLPEWLNKY